MFLSQTYLIPIHTETGYHFGIVEEEGDSVISTLILCKNASPQSSNILMVNIYLKKNKNED